MDFAKIIYRLLVRFTFLFILTGGILGGFLSTVAFAQTRPAIVRDVENPALSPFTASATLTISPGYAGAFGSPLAEVPDGMRLVIEHVSVICRNTVSNPIVSASISVTERTSIGSVSRPFQVPLGYQGNASIGGYTYVGSLSTRLYSDRGISGGGVTMGADRTSGDGTGSCSFAISGHTISLNQ
jgi:hypothetical protein